jgi:predicted NAD/FAD-dependent oxidoreductase
MHSDLEEVQRVLEEELERHVDVDCSTAVHRACHRWRYAKLHDSDREPLGAFLDPALGLAATGDWSASSRVEESWLSAARLAARLRSMVDRR